MVSASPQPDKRRAPLSRERILEAGVALADRDGLDALTMRNLAHELGVEAMSLYYHVANKEAILDGVIDVVVDEINQRVKDLELNSPTTDWKADMRSTIVAARGVLLSHPWAPAVIETRAALSFPVISYHDNLLRLMKEGGFSYDLAHHALHTLGSRGMGFSQELFQPDDAASEDDDASEMIEQMAAAFPYITGMLTEISHDPDEPSLGWCDDETEFMFAIDLLLDGLDRIRQSET